MFRENKISCIVFILSFKLCCASILTDRLKSLTDISFECRSSCHSNENDGIQILPIVGCESNEARGQFYKTFCCVNIDSRFDFENFFTLVQSLGVKLESGATMPHSIRKLLSLLNGTAHFISLMYRGSH